MKRTLLVAAVLATGLPALAADREPQLVSKPCGSRPAESKQPSGKPPQFRIGSTPFGHEQAPNHVVVDPQGEWLLTQDGGLLRLWDLRTGALVRQLRGAFRSVASRSRLTGYTFPCVLDVGFSPDGRTIYAADVDGVSLWTRASAERSSVVSALVLGDPSALPDPQWLRYAASADGRYVAVAAPNPVRIEREPASTQGRAPVPEDAGGSVSLVDARTGKTLWTEKLSFVVTAMAFSHSGALLALAGGNVTAQSDGAMLAMLPTAPRLFGRGVKTISLGRFAAPQSIAFDRADAEVLVFRRQAPPGDAVLVRVHLADGTVARQNMPARTAATSRFVANRSWAAVSADGKLAIVQVTIDRRWGVPECGFVPMDVESGNVTIPLDPLAFGAETVVPSPDGRYLVAWPSDYHRDAVLIEVATSKFVGTLPQSAARKVRAAFQPDGQRLLVARYDADNRGTLATFDMRGAPQPLRSVAISGDTSELAVSPDGRWVALNTRKPPYQGMLDAGGVIEVRDAATLELAFTTPEPARVERRQLNGLQFAPDASALWVAESWDVLSGVESSRRRVDKAHRIMVPGWTTTTFDRPGLPAWPLWVVRDRTIRARVVDRSPRFVTVDLVTGEQTASPSPGGYLEPLHHSLSGRLVAYAVDLGRGQIHVLDAFAPGTGMALQAEGCTSLRAARFASNDSMLFAACGNGAVVGWKLS